MIAPLTRLKLMPIELAGFAQSIILGTPPDGEYAAFLEYLKEQTPQYKRMFAKQHGSLHFKGATFEEFEDLHGDLPSFIKNNPYDSNLSTAPHYDSLVIFADKENFNKVLVKIVNSIGEGKSKEHCWGIYKGFYRTVKFSPYHKYANYFLSRAKFNTLLSAASSWDGLPREMIPLELKDKIKDEDIKQIVRDLQIFRARDQPLTDFALIHHILPMMYPNDFEYGMSWIDWHEAVSKKFPVTVKYLYDYPMFKAQSFSRLSSVLKKASEEELLINESTLLHDTYMTHLDPAAHERSKAESGRPFLERWPNLLTKSPDTLRRWAKEVNTPMYLTMLWRLQPVNYWGWDKGQL